MEQKFQKGEKVRITDLRQLEEGQVPFGINSDMLLHIGQIVTIKSVESSYNPASYSKYPCDGYSYRLSEVHWNWSNPMLEKLEGETEPHERVIEFV